MPLLLSLVTGAWAVGRKPLFDAQDQYVMLNDLARNDFYFQALALARERGRVLDLGAGSGLLALMAAKLGAKEVVAVEANPSLALLANLTIEKNRQLYPWAEISVVPGLSSALQLPPADLLVTETFGSLLLGEGVLPFVADARERLLKPGGRIIPAGGCQYATLVQLPDSSPWHPRLWKGFDLRRFTDLHDTLYWKATFGASRYAFEKLSERFCVLELDLAQMSPADVPRQRTYRIRASKDGLVHGVLLDWDVWADAQRTQVLSTAPGSRSFVGDVAWGWLLQLQEAAGDDWQLAESPEPLRVRAGQWLEVAVEFIAHGASMSVRVRAAGTAPGLGGAYPPLPDRLRREVATVRETHEFLLPVLGDQERHDFYAAAILDASRAMANATVVDCSVGTAGLFAASLGLRSVLVPHRDLAEIFSRHLNAEVVHGDCRTLADVLPFADILVLEPPGTPLHGLSPFALLPALRRGLVVPQSACLEAAFVESEELAQLASIPTGYWKEVDLRVWNEEARRQGVLERLVPYTKWLGQHSTMKLRWLSRPECVYHVDLKEWPNGSASKETVHVELAVEQGPAHALVARWAVFWKSRRLGAESGYVGRDWTWPQYVQLVAAQSDKGLLEPIALRKGRQKLELEVRQGSDKVTGAAGPEFTFRVGSEAARPEL